MEIIFTHYETIKMLNLYLQIKALKMEGGGGVLHDLGYT